MRELIVRPGISSRELRSKTKLSTARHVVAVVVAAVVAVKKTAKHVSVAANGPWQFCS